MSVWCRTHIVPVALDPCVLADTARFPNRMHLSILNIWSERAWNEIRSCTLLLVLHRPLSNPPWCFSGSVLYFLSCPTYIGSFLFCSVLIPPSFSVEGFYFNFRLCPCRFTATHIREVTLFIRLFSTFSSLSISLQHNTLYTKYEPYLCRALVPGLEEAGDV